MTEATAAKTLTVFAPAKINLYLHITGRQDKTGYHNLDSLVVFADIGDRITITPAGSFSFIVNGPYARAFGAAEKDSGAGSANLAVRAAYALAQFWDKEMNFKITLTKNLPLAAGLGGGSADAAAVIWALSEWWRRPVQPERGGLEELLLALGADVPACMACHPVHMSGIGDVIRDVPPVPEIPVLLVNPGKPCPTERIFKAYKPPFRAAASLPDSGPDSWGSRETFFSFLQNCHNDLTEAATAHVPEIVQIIEYLGSSAGCRLARMSGSGASCFGLFDEAAQTLDAAERIMQARPHWWVRSGTINRPQRY